MSPKTYYCDCHECERDADPFPPTKRFIKYECAKNCQHDNGGSAVANAARRGLSRSQARGHAKAGEATIRPSRPVDRERLELAIKAYRQSGRQIEAARSVGISVEKLRRYLRENVSIKRRGRTLIINDKQLGNVTLN